MCLMFKFLERRIDIIKNTTQAGRFIHPGICSVYDNKLSYTIAFQQRFYRDNICICNDYTIMK